MNLKKSKQLKLKVFSGPNAIQEFLDPVNHLPLYMVELPAEINPFAKEKVRIFAVLAYLLPLLNIKYLTALSMLRKAKAAGKLKGVHTLVESSSGNTVFSLAVLAPFFGIRRTIAIVPSDLARGKEEMLLHVGAKVIKHTGSETSGIERARREGKKPGHINLAQYENEANPAYMEEWLAPQIWRQIKTEGELSIFCAGMGTTGTALGASRYFKRKSKRIQILGIACKADNAVPGTRTWENLKEVRLEWRNAVAYIEGGAKDSYKQSLALSRGALFGGPSSGLALVGLFQFLEQQRDMGMLNALRSKNGEIIAVVVLPDTFGPYTEKYPTYLTSQEFGSSD